MGIVGLLISRGVRFMADGLNGPTNEEARKLLEIRLEEAQARHAEDLERLAREMSEVVAQRDESRRAEREYDSLVDSVRTALCASMSECTDVAARRVAGERDLARAERDKYFQACENWRKLDAPLSEFRRVLRVGDYESTLDAARRMSRELEVCLGQLDHVMAREKSTNLEAYALGRKSAEEQEAAWESERAELVARVDKVTAERDAAREELYDYGARERSALAALGDEESEGLVDAARRVVAERDNAIARAEKAEALHAEAEGQIACRNELRARIAELEARAEKAEAALESARASASLVTMVGDIGVRKAIESLLAQQADHVAESVTLRARVEGLETDLNSAVQNSKASEVEANSLRSANRTLRARVAELEAAPQGQPVATDEEVVAVFVAAERDALVTHRMGCAAADRYGALAVARHVRAERPACLVARAVALGCDVRVCEDVAGWLVAIHESSDLDEDVHRDVAASDVPATLARLLDEVEASRKGGAK